MAYRKKKAFRRRSRGARRRFGGYKRRVRRVNQIMPQNYFTKLTYHEMVEVGSSTGGTFTYHSWVLNSPYDPNDSLGGESCSGFDKLATMYGRYQVTAAKFRICAVNTGASTQYCGYHLRNSTEQVPTSWRDAVDTLTELPRSKWGLIGANTTADHTRKWLKGYVSFRKQFPGQYRDRDWGALIDASPSKKYYLTVVQADNDGTTEDLKIHFYVTITYYVRFTEPTFETY